MKDLSGIEERKVVMALPGPFSSRTQAKRHQIADDFPETARIGLLHLVRDLIDKGYIGGWPAVIRELQRIARATPVEYGSNRTEEFYVETVEELITALPWEKVYDFCERLHSYLAKDAGYYNDDYEQEFIIRTPKSEVQEFITSELQQLFHEEKLAFDFSDGSVQRRGRRHTAEKITKAQTVMGDHRLVSALTHYNKALQFFRNPPSKPDFENTVKEAVCAVEAAGKALFPTSKATKLGDLIKWLANNKDLEFPKSISVTFAGLYGFRGSGEGVAHGGTEGGAATAELAEYVLSVAASQIILLVDLAQANDQDVPF
ncbi:MAG: hypothetical protein LC794_00450 [Acidobacteria bacterium]|nr:hypothetical protein [Acidobacteriota bacterium]